ncbi:50S ribosomal protein L1 [Candidatus Woesearchaeota archaeon B3_Woes]|nr:MAG: 50S ribosomal protein L1 [Candidatus Woesearchaeota archaeon B3_Woes]
MDYLFRDDRRVQMEKNDFIKALKKSKDNSPKRKFKQSYDLIINLRNLDLKKTENQIDNFIQLHYDRGKKVKICALIGSELKATAKEECDMAIELIDFDKYAKNKKLTKKLAQDYDFFIAQANIMPKVAAAFGKILGTKGKMPNPKAGCIVPPNANLKAVVAKLQNSVRVRVNISPLFQCRIGKEDTPEEHLIDNAFVIYNSMIHSLPGEKNNIRSVYLKLTMGPSIKIGTETVEEAPKEKKKEAKVEDKKQKD